MSRRQDFQRNHPTASRVLKGAAIGGAIGGAYGPPGMFLERKSKGYKGSDYLLGLGYTATKGAIIGGVVAGVAPHLNNAFHSTIYDIRTRQYPENHPRVISGGTGALIGGAIGAPLLQPWGGAIVGGSIGTWSGHKKAQRRAKNG